MASRSDIEYAISSLGRVGLNRTQALGALGSMMGESGRSLNTGAYNPNDPGDGSFGIAQWHSERRRGLERFARAPGRSLTSFRTQIDYVAEELRTTEKRALNSMKKAKTLGEAVKNWTNKFERPDPKYAHMDRRISNAKYALGLVNGTQKPVVENAKKSLTQAQLPGKQALDTIGGVVSAITGATGNAEGEMIVGPDGNEVSTKIGFGGPTPEQAAAGIRLPDNPLIDYNSAYPGRQSISPQQAMGIRNDPIGKAFMGIVTAAAGGPLAVGMSLAKSFMGNQGPLAKTAEKEKSGFWGNPTAAAKIGAVGGAAFGGPVGGLIGGLVGQAIGGSLNNIATDMGGSAMDFATPDPSLNQFPGAPSGGSFSFADSGGQNVGGRGRDISPGAQDAIDSGKAGLF